MIYKPLIVESIADRPNESRGVRELLRRRLAQNRLQSHKGSVERVRQQSHLDLHRLLDRTGVCCADVTR